MDRSARPKYQDIEACVGLLAAQKALCECIFHSWELSSKWKTGCANNACSILIHLRCPLTAALRLWPGWLPGVLGPHGLAAQARRLAKKSIATQRLRIGRKTLSPLRQQPPASTAFKHSTTKASMAFAFYLRQRSCRLWPFFRTSLDNKTVKMMASASQVSERKRKHVGITHREPSQPG